MSEPMNANRATAYHELCASYRAIDEFRTKLLGFLPFATGGGILLIWNAVTEDTDVLLIPVGAFGFIVTLGLYFYELHGVRKCDHLIRIGAQLEREMDIEGQFSDRPDRVDVPVRPFNKHFGINEPFAARMIYPAVLTTWTFLALWSFLGWAFKSDQVVVLAALLLSSLVFVAGFVFPSRLNLEG